jgi:predicted kinase
MLEVVIFVGLQGAGKSTLYAQRFAHTHALVSKDRFRNNRRPERRQQRLLHDALAGGMSVVVDNTNPSPAERQALLDIARARRARVVGYYFDAPFDACAQRNETRPPERRVPHVGLVAAARRLVRPTLAEGFDEVFSVATLADFRFEITLEATNDNGAPR